MQILCVDPGIVSVGLFGAAVDAAWSVVEVTTCTNVDLTATKGPLHAQICAFLDAWSGPLGLADLLILERQPFQSAGFPLELLLRDRFLPKCVFVSPNTLHKHFGSAGYTYDGRKDRAVRLVTSTLQVWEAAGVRGCALALAHLSTFERKHDCCDAGLLLLYYLNKRREPAAPPSLPVPPVPTYNLGFSTFLQQYMYKASPLRSKYFTGGTGQFPSGTHSPSPSDETHL